VYFPFNKMKKPKIRGAYPVENPPVPALFSFFCIFSGSIGVVSSNDGGGAIAALPPYSTNVNKTQNH